VAGIIIGWGLFDEAEIQMRYKEVGVLHSLSGPLAVDERHVVDATLLAIEEINEEGGLLGHKLKVVLRDGFSDEKVFATEMQRMLTQDKVDVVFGCWTSGSRKAVLPSLTSNNGLLFYPVQYEGVESHPNVVYTGTHARSPNSRRLLW
jgi:urea transport system substrate-binding protein